MWEAVYHLHIVSICVDVYPLCLEFLLAWFRPAFNELSNHIPALSILLINYTRNHPTGVG